MFSKMITRPAQCSYLVFSHVTKSSRAPSMLFLRDYLLQLCNYLIHILDYFYLQMKHAVIFKSLIYCAKEKKIIKFQRGRNGFYLGEDRKFFFNLGEDRNQFFPNISIILYNKNILFPKFRGGSILRSSSVPPSLV